MDVYQVAAVPKSCGSIAMVNLDVCMRTWAEIDSAFFKIRLESSVFVLWNLGK